MTTQRKTAAVLTLFFLLHTLEFFAGLFAIRNQSMIPAAVVLLLLACNPVLQQIYRLWRTDRGQNPDKPLPCPVPPELPDTFDEQIAELTKHAAALREENTRLSEKLGALNQTLSRAPLIYRCPLTAAAPVSMGKILRTYLGQHEADFCRADIHVSFHSEPGSYETLLSRAALSLIFDNLLDNTLKYTPRGGCLVITLAKHQKDLLLIWKNSGSGILNTDTGKVFDLNYRQNQNGSGTGLGLAQVRAIADDYGAAVWAKSSSKKGFSIYLLLPPSRKK